MIQILYYAIVVTAFVAGCAHAPYPVYTYHAPLTCYMANGWCIPTEPIERRE
jgi:hypothetical protein